MRQLQLFVKRWLNGLYLVAFAFFGAGVVLLLLPELKGQVWQIIGGAFLGAGLTILVTTISARQSILEQYNKDANLRRKREVYGPLHAELKELREILDDVQAGKRPFPQWIEIMGDEFRPSLYHTAYARPTFSYWPMFKKNYHGDDDFTHRTQNLLEDVQNCIKAYNEAIEAAHRVTQEKLRQRLESIVVQEERSQAYREWQKKRDQPASSNTNTWFEFIEILRTSASDRPLGDVESRILTASLGWILTLNVDQAAKEVYENDIESLRAGGLVPLSWFEDLFRDTLIELKKDPSYQYTMDAKERLVKRLLDAENKLKGVINYIRDCYQGGPPPV